MRNLEKSSKIMDLAKKDSLPLEVLRLDVTDENSIKDAVNIIIEKKDKLMRL
jgi:hypothetical protein